MRSRAVRLLQGCLMAMGVVLVGVILLVVIFRLAGKPDHEPRTAQLEQTLPGVTASQLAAEGLDPGAQPSSDKPVHVNVRLEEGSFTLRAGPPGSAVKVEGDYDAGVYELKQDLTRDSDGVATYTLSFRPRYTMLSRILRQGFVHLEEDSNRMSVSLPRDLPMALSLKVSKGKSELDLSGLSLTSAMLDLSMGEHDVVVEEPNPIEMDRLEIHGGMGEVSLSGLGNLRSSTITAWGRMGEFHLDMGETIGRDTTLMAKMKMGELSLGLPSNARLEVRRSVFLADAEDTPKQDGPEDPNKSFALKIDAGATLGELRFTTR